MKVRFNETEYELITRDLQDARLKLTLLKGESDTSEIEEDIRTSEGITILDGEGEKIAEYVGFTDVIVIRAYETAVAVELINNVLLTETMAVAGRVADLESGMSTMGERVGNLDNSISDLNESQNGQDEIITEILETM